MRANIRVSGIVQGVGFRPFIYRIATSLDLKGYVLNLGDAGVEIVVQGEKNKIQAFLHVLEEEAPPLATIDTVIAKYISDEPCNKFEIRKSRNEKEEGTSVIPPDIAMCDKCLSDMQVDGRRHKYFFTTCTNCGPRFTIIRTLPYDRSTTAMEPFIMCDLCRKEYADPFDRRYHAQTIACNNCGPRLFLAYNNQRYENLEALHKAIQLLKNGNILAVKGVGGFHLACLAREDIVMRLRNILGRQQKPFALMMRDMDTVKSYAVTTAEEEHLLKSHMRPIVLLQKRKELPAISPGLHTFGIMLPYTGLHHLFFSHINFPLVMSSANMPGLPIIYREDEIKSLGADGVLFYDRDILQRCDDSIIRIVGKMPLIIRRSRGYVPSGIKLNKPMLPILALGAEENITACLLKNKQAYLTQYIGHLQSVETFSFLEEAVNYLSSLIDFRPVAVACDQHPQFLTSSWAEELSSRQNISLFRVQHHYAHIAAVMAEHELFETIGIAIDGMGYGDDGNAWGGEIMHCNLNHYKRIGHLQPHPLPGGDRATYYPLRFLAGILGEESREFLIERVSHFPHGLTEVDVVFKQLHNQLTHSSSCGRLLDAVAALLDICYAMSYEGESAMKLETVASGGSDVLKLEPAIHDDIIDTAFMVRQIFENRHLRTKDLAYSAQEYVACALAELAVEKAINMGIDSISLAGGCAYNEHMNRCIREHTERAGLRFFINRQVPCGDGGISLGQAIVANAQLNL